MFFGVASYSLFSIAQSATEEVQQILSNFTQELKSQLLIIEETEQIKKHIDPRNNQWSLDNILAPNGPVFNDKVLYTVQSFILGQLQRQPTKEENLRIADLSVSEIIRQGKALDAGTHVIDTILVVRPVLSCDITSQVGQEYYLNMNMILCDAYKLQYKFLNHKCKMLYFARKDDTENLRDKLPFISFIDDITNFLECDMYIFSNNSLGKELQQKKSVQVFENFDIGKKSNSFLLSAMKESNITYIDILRITIDDSQELKLLNIMDLESDLLRILNIKLIDILYTKLSKEYVLNQLYPLLVKLRELGFYLYSKEFVEGRYTDYGYRFSFVHKDYYVI
jgi:hypothetical protein